MARATMADLITRLRLMVYDPAGDTQTFGDDELQDFLDRYRHEIRYMRLSPLETIQPGGSVVTLVYRAPVGWWEGNTALYDGSYEAVSPGTADLVNGRWTFAAHQSEPVYLVGMAYDLYAAAVDVLTAWLAQLKYAYDFTADGASFHRAQQIQNIQRLIATYNQAGGPQVMTLTRGDVL